MMDYDYPYWEHSDTVNNSVNLLLHLVIDILPRVMGETEKDVVQMLDIAARLSQAIPFESAHPDTTRLYERLFDALAGFLTLEVVSLRMLAFDLMQVLFPIPNVITGLTGTFNFMHAKYVQKKLISPCSGS